jgi:lysine-N-methylase
LDFSNLFASAPERHVLHSKAHLTSVRCQERRLTQFKLVRPTYSKSFHCAGAACEDTCCQGWSVYIDQAAYEKYLELPVSPLQSLIASNMLVIAEGAKPASFARIQMNSANQCPLLSEERLCRIQAEFGEGWLSHACATYPRILVQAGGEKETALALSCPEAARLVLLSPGLLVSGHGATPEGADRELAAETESTETQPLENFFHPIRAQAVALLQNRAYLLWQRLFLLSLFCRRLDAIAAGELKRSVPDFLVDFESAVSSGSLRTAMESLPMDRAAQLDVVLRLAGLMLHRSNVRPRFVECIQAFTTGIGNGPGATLESLTARYTVAHDRYYAPFFDLHAHILENYLINSVFRRRFPFGQREAQPDAQPGSPVSMSRECALLTAQFALMKGLLIGVAGYYREGFSHAHVVHTIQAASKHFEHHPEFLSMAHTLLMESRMDGARGMAILLRNAEPNTVSRSAKPAPLAIQLPAAEGESTTTGAML